MLKLPTLRIESLSLDLRSLALFRVGLALYCLCTALDQAGLLSALYSDAGVLPRALLMGQPDAVAGRLQPLALNGSALFVQLLWLLGLLAGLALLLGYRARLAGGVLFLCTLALINRNPYAALPQDTLAVCLLFWTPWLPLGARWSLDAALATTSAPTEHAHVSWAGAAFSVQIVCALLAGAWLRMQDPAWNAGTALEQLLASGHGISPLAPLLAGQTWLLRPLTQAGHYLLGYGPLLLVLPYLTAPARSWLLPLLLVLALLWGLLAGGGGLTLAALLALLGPGLWQRLARRHTLGQGLQIYFDGDCAFCRGACRALAHFLILPQAQCLPAQDSPRAWRLVEANGSWVVIDADAQAHLRWSAFVLLLRRSPLAAWLAPLAARLTRPGDALYDAVVRQRARIGRLLHGLLRPRRVHFVPGRWPQGLALLVGLAVLASNLGVTQPADPLLRLLRLDQRWELYAPPVQGPPGQFQAWLSRDAGPEAPLPLPQGPRWDRYHAQLGRERAPALLARYAQGLCAGLSGEASVRLGYLVRNRSAGGLEQQVLGRYPCQR